MGERAGGAPGAHGERERERENEKNTHLVGRIRKSGRTKSVVSHISCLLACLHHLHFSISFPINFFFLFLIIFILIIFIKFFSLSKNTALSNVM